MEGCDVHCRCRNRNMQGASLYTRACRDEAAEMGAEGHMIPVYCSIIELTHLGRLVHVEGEVLEVRQRIQQWRHAPRRHRLLLAVSDVAEPATHQGHMFHICFSCTCIRNVLVIQGVTACKQTSMHSRSALVRKELMPPATRRRLT